MANIILRGSHSLKILNIVFNAFFGFPNTCDYTSHTKFRTTLRLIEHGLRWTTNIMLDLGSATVAHAEVFY
jgi:hypothetical protein